MKIAVIGYTGSGKSVLAAKLGKILGCPVLHLDKLQFEAGWKERKEAEGNRLCEQFLEENKERGWVIDGNYEKFCQKRRMKEADLIIFMDYPRWICLWQALRRYYRYKGHTRKSMADGCIEKMDKEFILWILKNGRSREKKEDYKRVGAQYPDKFIQVRNRRQLRATVIRLLQLQNEKGLYAGTGSRKKVKKEELLIERLKKYRRSDMYPFHMPGHKRAEGIKLSFPDPFSVDITEIDGFDNLHHPEGILKESMKWASSLYGSDHTWYLVNGSTCGLLSAISAAVPHRGKILVSRNCHKAVYHGIYLNHLEAVYVYPQPVPGLGIQGGILPEDVENALKNDPDIQAVLIVSPTYDGIVSDVEAIAKIVHKAGLPLIVDEAHGAHFAYGDAFPKSALELGADAVIQSVHKTLPSLTQTALLHVKNNRPDGGCYLDVKKVERYLQIYQSSSPSYVLMASIENSIFLMDQYRKEGKVAEFEAALLKIRKKLGKMKPLRLVERDLRGTAGIFDVDISKIVVSVRGSGLTGEMLSQILRDKYHLEMEMCGADYVTAIAAIGDSKKGLKRLKKALLEIDKELEKNGNICNDDPDENVYSRHAKQVMPVFKAMDGEKEAVPLKESCGRICGEFAYIYPPGIPLLAPGEQITEEILETLQDYIKKDLPVQGLEDTDLVTIQVMALSGGRSV